MTFVTPVFGVGGLLSVLMALYHGRLMLRHRSFPTTMGTLLDKRVVRSQTDEGGTTYYPSVSYRYQVNGKDYVSDRLLDLGPFGHLTTSLAGRAMARLEIGGAVRISYDPARPDFAFIRLGPWMMVWFPFLLGTLFLAVAWWALRRG